MPVFKKLFPSKLLLFGEYSIILTSRSLSVPFHRYGGRFVLPGDPDNPNNSKAIQSNQSLYTYYEFLFHAGYHAWLNLEQFRKDIEKGLFFDSNIPEGYGLGSSGALVAATVYDYSLKKPEIQDIPSLFLVKTFFSRMESFFHGRSSGIDPLTSYLNQIIYIRSSKKAEMIPSLPRQNTSRTNLHMLLIDTGISSHTKPWVDLFVKKSEDTHYKNRVVKELDAINKSCIEFYLESNSAELFNQLKVLSNLELELFPEMIPEEFIPLWEEGLKTNCYYLKLLGSGGGGFLLAFSHDDQMVKKKFSGYHIEPFHTVN